jgi:conjugate transposon protein
MENMYSMVNMFSVDNLVQMAFRKVIEVIFQGASLIVDVIRTFFLIVLSVLGPLAFAISVFDGFHNTLIQ